MNYRQRADQDTDGTIDDIDGAAYWQRRDADLTTPAPAMSDAERADRRIAALTALRADSGLTAAQAADLAALEVARTAEVAAMRQAAADAFAAEWTVAATTERRAAYNAAVQNPAYRSRSGIVLEGKLEEALGFTRTDLVAAVQRHGL